MLNLVVIKIETFFKPNDMEKEVFEKMDQPSKMILTVYNPGQEIPSLCREISENCVEQIGESSNEVEGEGNQSELIINISQVINTFPANIDEVSFALEEYFLNYQLEKKFK